MFESVRFTCDQADVAEPVRPVLQGRRFLVQALPDNTTAVSLGGPPHTPLPLAGDEELVDVIMSTGPVAATATAQGFYLEKALDFIDLPSVQDLWLTAATADEGIMIVRIE
jgi:hypothetical protein